MNPPARYRDGGPFEEAAGYSRAVRQGAFIAVSGTCALDTLDVSEGSYPQTREALERALAAALKLGAQPTDVIRTRLLLAPECDWTDAVRAHAELFRDLPPANTTVFVARLIPEGALVEVELDAIASNEPSDPRNDATG
jgi:enamine deaminase RidA (YjgF/YER057c/UK114 family)